VTVTTAASVVGFTRVGSVPAYLRASERVYAATGSEITHNETTV
jgi:hypothetical protein